MGPQGIKGREDSTIHISQLFPLLPSSLLLFSNTTLATVQLHTITMIFNVNAAAVAALALTMAVHAAPSGLVGHDLLVRDLLLSYSTLMSNV